MENDFEELLERIKLLCDDPSEEAYEGRCLWDNTKVFNNWSACQERLSQIEDAISDFKWNQSQKVHTERLKTLYGDQ